MSSIYDDPQPSGNQPYREPSPFGAAPAAVPNAEPYQPPAQQPPQPANPPPTPAKKSGCGCFGCGLFGCFGVILVCLIGGGIAVWFFVQKLPDIAREGIAQTVQQSDLSDQDKKMVIGEVDRLVDGYKQGKIDMQKLGKFAEDFAQSPLMDLLVAFGARVKYLEKSGLSDEEKKAAEKTLQRLAKGTIDKKIGQDDLNKALDFISTRTGNNGRQFHDNVSDDTLRQFLAESKRLADEAKVSEEDVQVDIGAELKKLVDRALGESEPEAPAAAPAEAPAETPAEPGAPAEEKADSAPNS